MVLENVKEVRSRYKCVLVRWRPPDLFQKIDVDWIAKDRKGSQEG